jgi:UDP-2,3-diacylglucosamine hydrolase
MTTYFISDLHLSDYSSDITENFLSFIENHIVTTNTKADALYILGDLFDFWVGDDYLSDTAEKVAKTLKQASQKTPIYYMQGNRDFLLNKSFCDLAGMKLIPDPIKINLYNTPTLLTHGDSLCMLDKKYTQFRAFSRNRLIQKLFLAIPVSLRLKIANYIREKSTLDSRKKSAEIMDVSPEAVIQLIQTHQVKRLIHGHTHRPAHHKVFTPHTPTERFVLGAWENHGEILICDKSGCQLKKS